MSPMVVAVIGIVACVLAFGLIFWFMYLPTKQDADAAEARYDAAYPDSTLQQQQAAAADLVKAKQEVGQTKAKWTVIEDTIMPPFDVSNRYKAWKQLSNELSYNLGPSLQHWIDSTGIVPLTSVSLPAPPANPNLITAAPLVIPINGSSIGGAESSGAGFGGMGGYPGSGGGGGGAGGGAITVGGSFRQILKHVQLWNSYKRLVLVDNLSLHGNSPYMTGSYNASVIIFPQNDTNVAKPLPAASSGTAGGGMGGYPGAMPGAFGG